MRRWPTLLIFVSTAITTQKDILKDLFLGIYANPVSNKIKLGKI